MPSPGLDAKLFKEGGQIILISKRHSLRQNVEYVKEIKGSIVLKLSHFDSIADAYKIVDCSLFMEGEAPNDRQENSLVHFIVKDTDGRLWGTVKSIKDSGLNPLIEVEANGEVIDVPFHEEIVKQIDWGARTIVLDPPEGLRDLNR